MQFWITFILMIFIFANIGICVKAYVLNYQHKKNYLKPDRKGKCKQQICPIYKQCTFSNYEDNK